MPSRSGKAAAKRPPNHERLLAGHHVVHTTNGTRREETATPTVQSRSSLDRHQLGNMPQTRSQPIDLAAVSEQKRRLLSLEITYKILLIASDAYGMFRFDFFSAYVGVLQLTRP
jgi:hypothetical protein